MISEELRKFDLTSFKSAVKDIIATNDNAWNESKYGFRIGNQHQEYTEEKVKEIIDGNDIQAQQRLSRYYFSKDGFYKRIILYYATLLKYAGMLIPNPTYGTKLSNKAVEKAFYKAIGFTDLMSIPSMALNCAVKALIDGTYFGVIANLSKSSFALLDLPSLYCRTRYKDINGNDIIEFDITYFNTITDEQARKLALNSYPKIFKQYYNKYKDGKIKNNYKWLLIPTDIGVCFPFFESKPLFLNIIPTTMNYEVATETEIERELEEIRKIIVQKIPHLNDGGLLFEPEEAAEIHAGTVKMMKHNKNVSVLTTYADVDSIVSRTSAESVTNNLEKMAQNIYSKAGVSGQLFGSNSNLALSVSITNDMTLMMHFANKIGTFVTNIVNRLYGKTSCTFEYRILPISYYNVSDYITDSFKLAQSGYSLMLPALAMDLTQKQFLSIKELESDVLKLHELLIPLQSAYTQSGDSEPGAPEKKDTEKTDKTIKNITDKDKEGGN